MNQEVFFKSVPSWMKKIENSTISSSIRIVRNYKDNIFSKKMSKEQSLEIEKKTDKQLKAYLISGEMTKIDLATLSNENLSLLQEKKIIPKLNKKEYENIKLYVYKDLSSFILLNYNDHLSFYAFAESDKITTAYNRGRKMLSFFNDQNFAKDKKGNYFTSDISFFGSGLKMFMLLALPYLKYSSQFSNYTEFFKQNGFVYESYFNFGSVLEDLTIIGNDSCFGIEPKTTLKKMKLFVKEILKEENKSKNNFNDNNFALIKRQIKNSLKKKSIYFNNYVSLYLNILIASDFLKMTGTVQKQIDLSINKATQGLMSLQKKHLIAITNDESIKLNEERLNQVKQILPENFIIGR